MEEISINGASMSRIIKRMNGDPEGSFLHTIGDDHDDDESSHDQSTFEERTINGRQNNLN